MIERIVRAIRLDWTVFQEIAQDPRATRQAAILVVIVSFLSSVGEAISARSFTRLFGAWIVAILVGWLLWAVITYLVGTSLFQGKTTFAAMARVLGYATAPHLLGLFRILPCIGVFMPALGWVLALVAGVLAVREAMEFETDRALITVFISWVISVGIQLAFQWIF